MLSVHETPNIFDDPHWELIFYNKWHPETSEISIPPELALETLFHAWHGSLKLPCLKLPRYFYVLMEKPLGRYFQVRSPYYQAVQCNQKTPVPVSSRWQVTSQKAKKGNTNHSYHQCSSPFASLDWSNNKIILSFNQPNRKRWRVRLVDAINHLPIKYFYCENITKSVAKEAPSPHEERLTPLNTNPVFSCLEENTLIDTFFRSRKNSITMNQVSSREVYVSGRYSYWIRFNVPSIYETDQRVR